MKKFVILFFLLIFGVMSYGADVMIKGITSDYKDIKYVVVDDSGQLIVKSAAGDTYVYITNFPAYYIVYSDSYSEIINAINSISFDTNVNVTNFPAVYVIYSDSFADVINAINNKTNVYDTQLENLAVDIRSGSVSIEGTIETDTNVYVVNMPELQLVYDTQLEGVIDVNPSYLTTDYDTSFVLSDTDVILTINGYFEIWGDTDVVLNWSGVEHTLPLSTLRIYKSDFSVNNLSIRNANGIADGKVEVIKIGR